MAITSQASGSQTCTVNGTEYTLNSGSFSVDGSYVLGLDINDLANGEELVIKVYNKVKSDGTERIVYQQTIANAQTIPVIHTDPIPVTNSCKFSVTQSVGSGAVVVWEVWTL